MSKHQLPSGRYQENSASPFRERVPGEPLSQGRQDCPKNTRHIRGAILFWGECGLNPSPIRLSQQSLTKLIDWVITGHRQERAAYLYDAGKVRTVCSQATERGRWPQRLQIGHQVISVPRFSKFNAKCQLNTSNRCLGNFTKT